MYRNVPTTPADKSIPNDYIEREEDYAYVELDRKTAAVLAAGFCLDGIGCVWFDNEADLFNDYEPEHFVYYYTGQLAD